MTIFIQLIITVNAGTVSKTSFTPLSTAMFKKNFLKWIRIDKIKTNSKLYLKCGNFEFTFKKTSIY